MFLIVWYLMVGEFGGKIQILKFSDFFKNIFSPISDPMSQSAPSQNSSKLLGHPTFLPSFIKIGLELRPRSCRQTDRQTDGHDEYISPFFS